MRLVVFLSVLALALSHSTPIILITPQQKHAQVLNSFELISFLSQDAQLLQISGAEQELVRSVRQIIDDLKIESDKISSFVVQDQKWNEIQMQTKINSQSISVSQLGEKLKGDAPIVLHLQFNDTEHTSSIRILSQTKKAQGPAAVPTKNTDLFDNMTPSVLSGLFVGLFLFVMMGIALKCLFEIKTNDRFARNNLWVGKEA